MATQQIGYYGTAYYFIRAGEDIQDAKKQTGINIRKSRMHLLFTYPFPNLLFFAISPVHKLPTKKTLRPTLRTQRTLYNMYSRRESNPDLKFRKLSFYPLNYKSLR